MAVNRYKNNERAWYAISTYGGYEDKVANGIKERVESGEIGRASCRERVLRLV